jgi:hypothetical protein
VIHPKRIKEAALRASWFNVLLSAILLVLFSFMIVVGQGGRPSTPNLNQRLESEKLLRDNERLRRGMEADNEARAKSKEERRAVANEAFVRIKALHNEILPLTLPNEKINPKRVAELVTETRKRAIQLRANLDLPITKEKSDKKEDKEVEPVNESLSRLCDFIRSFVTNLNQSPTDNKAAEQARKDLDAMVELSEKIVTVVGPTNP